MTMTAGEINRSMVVSCLVMLPVAVLAGLVKGLVLRDFYSGVALAFLRLDDNELFTRVTGTEMK